MYRHLLVPLDGTDLSTQIVGQSVEFARKLGARVTFFHALPDEAATLRSGSEVVWTTSPGDSAYAFDGRARELLSKAEAAARALGVPCSASSAVSDKPYDAILAAARNAGCDLIYMASHGRRSNLGMVLGSQTLKVLMQSEVAVLVAATSNPAAPARAIGIIRDEHRSLAAVLHAWMHLIATARSDGTAPDRVLMRAMVQYLRDFPVALHHPKEEDFLFAKLRSRTSALDAELDELGRQHDRDKQLVAELGELVDREPFDLAALEQAVGGYATFIWEHLGREEGVILPAAQRHLKDEDWAEIDSAFSANCDPRFGADIDLQYRRLFSRIVSLAPPAAGPRP